MPYKLENNIPLSPMKSGPVTGPWPWPDMEVTQSVFIPAFKGESSAAMRKRVKPYAYGKKHGRSFATRWVEKNGKPGIRVWRTK